MSASRSQSSAPSSPLVTPTESTPAAARHGPHAAASTAAARPAGVRAADSRGSVLVFVVGILLLLAIVATAFLGTSRADRTSTQQNAYNTQIDLLLEGIVNAAKAKISADESIPGHPNFEAFDAFTTSLQLGRTSDDSWLASRVPMASDITANYSAGKDNLDDTFTLNRAFWPTVSAAILGDTFESPGRVNAVYQGSLQYSARERLYPTFAYFNGKAWPAFRVDTAATPLPGNSVAATRYQTFLAGDADGDGVADSGLFRLPIGQLAGVTYFGAVRIIDNNSAVNVSTAMSRDWQFDGFGTGSRNTTGSTMLGSAGQFLSSVGLLEMLRSYPTGAPTPPQFDRMYAGPLNEFQLLTDYRLGLADTNTMPRLVGVVNATAAYGILPRSDTNVLRPDFQYATMGHALGQALGERMKNPNYVSYSSGAPTKAKSAETDALSFAARFAIGNGDGVNTLGKALGLSVGTDTNTPPLYQLRKTPYDGASPNNGIDGWFQTNFDYTREVFSDPTPNTSTFLNRKTILVGTNPTSNLDAAPTTIQGANRDTIRPPDQLFDRTILEGLANGSVLNGSNLYRQRNSYGVLNPPSTVDNVVQPPMTIPGGTNGTFPRSKVSINTARFEELFYGFFKVMAREGFLGDGLGGGTPYSNFYNGAIAARNGLPFTPTAGDNAAPNFYYRDPYIGMRFTPPIAPTMNTASANRADPRASIANGEAGPEQHPLRQFRSVLRAPHDRGNLLPTTGFWDDNTPYLPPDQVLILRAAIAAANAEALRNNSGPATGVTPPTQDQHNDRIVPHQVPLTAYLPPRPPANEFTDPATPQRVVANVYGLRRQPFITEVFVDTDEDTAAGDPANPRGYIAIRLYNPHPVAISLQHCRLVGLRRYRESAAPTQLRGAPTVTQYPHMQVLPYAAPTAATTNDQLDLSTLLDSVTAAAPEPWVIPANGYLVIENFPGAAAGADPTTDATHRSTAIDGANLALFTGTQPSLNNTRVAYLPHLSSVVYDREMVLMRPLGATPPATATGTLEYVPEDDIATSALPTRQINRYAPLDSYDFTGLNYPNAAVDGPIRARAQRWFYKRPSRTATARDQWRCVYPGRYDANQSIQPAGTDPRPRQQGTNEAYNTVGELGRTLAPPQDWQTVPMFDSPIFIGPPSSLNFYYPDTAFKIPLNDSGSPSELPLHSTPPSNAAAPVNLYPYGGFRRAGDLLQVPFIGSYTIQTEVDAITAGSENTFVEVNSVTMDAALAEDTDVDDNPTVVDATPMPTAAETARSREQIGRFAPLRASTVSVGTSGDPAAESVPDGSNRRWVFLNGGFTNDARRYQDEMDDDVFRQYTSLPYGPGAPVPPPTPEQAFTNRYAWTRTLFDHFTIHAPQDDYFGPYPTQPRWRPATRYVPGDAVQFGSDVFVCLNEQTAAQGGNDPPATAILDPNGSTNTWQRLPRVPVGNSNAANVGNRSDIGGNVPSFSYNPPVLPVANNNDVSESSESVQGLVNINTAPERVLAMIPWLPPGDNYSFGAVPPYVIAGASNVSDNEEIARMIVAYRDGVVAGPLNRAPGQEPFRSIYDLYKIPWFQAVQRELLAAGDPGPIQGSYSPIAVDRATRNDFEEQYLLMNRVSNLITTRSDAFTIYVLVQGWRNVGSASPELVSQRRAAVMVDRSRMSYEGAETLKQLSKIPTQ